MYIYFKLEESRIVIIIYVHICHVYISVKTQQFINTVFHPFSNLQNELFDD